MTKIHKSSKAKNNDKCFKPQLLFNTQQLYTLLIKIQDFSWFLEKCDE